jgi:hypothetical protein
MGKKKEAQIDISIEYFKEKHYVKTGGSGEFYYKLDITAYSSDYVESVAYSEIVRL